MSAHTPPRSDGRHDEEPAPGLGLSHDALLLSAAAGALGDNAWAGSAADIAGAPRPNAAPEPPTYRALALCGIAVVLALADANRWEESHEQARFLARHFRSAEAPIGTIAGEGLAGLVTSAATRDREGMRDFAAFLLELYG